MKAPQDLAELPAVASIDDAEWSFADAKRRTDLVPIRARLRSPNADVRRRATLAGLGVSRIVRTFVEGAVRSRQLVELLPDYDSAPLRIYAILPGRRLLPPKVKALLEALG